MQTELIGDQVVEKHIKNFLDVLVLAILNDKPTYGYKIIGAIHRQFGVLLSPSSFYPLLHSLEDKGLTESTVDEGKKVYHVTSKGKKKLKSVFVVYEVSIQRICDFIKTNGEITT